MSGFESASEALTIKHMQLVAAGYSVEHADAAVSYAHNRAGGMASKASPAHQEGVYLTALYESLEGCARWIDGNNRAAREGDQARGIDLAVDEQRVTRGYRRWGYDGPVNEAGRAAEIAESKGAYAKYWIGREPG